MKWFWITFYLSLTVFIPALVGLLRFRKLDVATKFFVGFSAISFITEVGAHFYRLYLGNNMIVFNAYTVISSILIGHYIYNLNKERIFLYLFYGIAAFAVVETLIGGAGMLSNYSISALSIVTIAVLLYVFYEMATMELGTRSLVLSGGLLFYFMSNFLYFITASYLQDLGNMEYLLAFGITRSFTNTFSYGWYAIGIWKASI